MGAGGLIGLVSGLIGIDGHIFLAPILILRRRAHPKAAAALSSASILVNSHSALAGVIPHSGPFPRRLPLWVVVVALGGWMGAEFGARKKSPQALQKVLAGVLILAGAKLFLAG